MKLALNLLVTTFVLFSISEVSAQDWTRVNPEMNKILADTTLSCNNCCYRTRHEERSIRILRISSMLLPTERSMCSTDGQKYI
jgi:hypothetical protein